jgi:hypothetical protein
VRAQAATHRASSGHLTGAVVQVATDSLEAAGEDVSAVLAEMFGGLQGQDSRALGAILGCFAADAAAQPAHWNYAQTLYQQQLRQLGVWEEPEFMRPSLNAFYRIPCGYSTCCEWCSHL